MKDNKELILKVLVGSRAHNLANDNSDYDYRGVYVLPTRDILSLGFDYKGTHWLENDKEDQTTYEIGHFLHLATKCNPTILEIFKAPNIVLKESTGEEWQGRDFGHELVQLFPYIWNPRDAFNAFTGYGFNQRKKMLEKKDNRSEKYAVAYLRTLYNLIDLLQTGTFSLEVTDIDFRNLLLDFKNNWTTKNVGEVINLAESLIGTATIELQRHIDGNANFIQQPDIKKVNDFLITIRKEFLE